MAEERGATIIDPTASALKAVHDELSAFREVAERRFDGLTERTAKIEGLLEGFKLAFDQMDKRMTTMQWGIGLIVVIQIFTLGKLFAR